MMRAAFALCVLLFVCFYLRAESGWRVSDSTWKILGAADCNTDVSYLACDSVGPERFTAASCVGTCIQCSGSDQDEFYEPGNTYLRISGPDEPFECGEMGEGTLSWNGTSCQCNVTAYTGPCFRVAVYIDTRCGAG